MKNGNFRITYDGPALVNSTIDVRELAPALLAVGELLEASTAALCGKNVKAKIEVHASFKTGCFGIDFSLATDYTKVVRDLFAGQNATAIANAAAITGFVGLTAKGLLSAIKWLKGRKISKVDIGQNNAVLYVEEDSLEIEIQVLTLLRDIAVREALEKILDPLDHEGIDTFAVGTDKIIIDTIDISEKIWFKSPAMEDSLILDETRKMVFSIVSLAFKDDNKWRLHDGAATIHATINDIGFLSRVDQNIESFTKGDVLICLVRVKQWQTLSGVRTEYIVEEVIEHRLAATQFPMPF